MAREHNRARRLDLNVSHVKLRIVLLVLALIVAVASFTIGIRGLLNRNSGWQLVDAYPDGVDCSTDFALQYFFGTTELNSTTEYKAVSALYSLALEDAYQAFYPEGELAGINVAVNAVAEVSPALYHALEEIQNSGNRCLYLAPAYQEYDRIFLYLDETQAKLYDPGLNAEMGDYVAQIAAYANDPAAIDLELLGDNKVSLRVSEAYLDFARENGIDVYLDFGWMRNAFICDYIADRLAENGYTAGYLASYDGFTRNLDSREQDYSFNLFDLLKGQINRPAVLHYNGPVSIVYLRSYPMSNADRWHYFSYSDGRIATAFVDPESGMNKCATDSLVAYAEDTGCAALLLQLTPVFLADVLDTAALESLAEQQIYSVWFDGTELKHTQASPSVSLTEEGAAMGYEIA